MRWLALAVLGGLALLSSCRSVPDPFQSEPELWRGVVPIGQILIEPQRFDGESVTLLVFWRGQDLLDELPGDPLELESAWVVADPTGAMRTFYPWPSLWLWYAVPIANVEDELFRLKGWVRQWHGEPYLEVEEVDWVEGLPWGTVLRVDRVEADGWTRNLWIQKDGRAYLVNWKEMRASRFYVPERSARIVVEEILSLGGRPQSIFSFEGPGFVFHTWVGQEVAVWAYPDSVGLPKGLRERLEEWLFPFDPREVQAKGP